MNTYNDSFYNWLQQELKIELSKVYKRIYRIRIFGDNFCIWFLNNDDSISIPLNIMKCIFDNGKSVKELSAIIDVKYIERIKK